MQSLYNLARKAIIPTALAVASYLPSGAQREARGQELGGLAERVENLAGNKNEVKRYGDLRDYLFRKDELPEGFRLASCEETRKLVNENEAKKEDILNPSYYSQSILPPFVNEDKSDIVKFLIDNGIEEVVEGHYISDAKNKKSGLSSLYLMAVRCKNKKTANNVGNLCLSLFNEGEQGTIDNPLEKYYVPLKDETIYLKIEMLNNKSRVNIKEIFESCLAEHFSEDKSTPNAGQDFLDLIWGNNFEQSLNDFFNLERLMKQTERYYRKFNTEVLFGESDERCVTIRSKDEIVAKEIVIRRDNDEKKIIQEYIMANKDRNPSELYPFRCDIHSISFSSESISELQEQLKNKMRFFISVKKLKERLDKAVSN